MNESDAFAIAQHDTALATARIQEAENPENAHEVISTFIRHRLEGLIGAPRASVILERSRAREARTLSEAVANESMSIIQACGDGMIPEDGYAMLTWLAGDEKRGDGFVIAMLKIVPDQITNRAIPAVIHMTKKVRDAMNARDQALFTRTRGQLKPRQANMIDGILSDANFAAKQGDGERARDKMILARTMIRRFQKIAERNAQLP